MRAQGPRKVIKQFQEDPETRVFLLTRGQGAAGLTLTQGVHVIITGGGNLWPRAIGHTRGSLAASPQGPATTMHARSVACSLTSDPADECCLARGMPARQQLDVAVS